MLKQLRTGAFPRVVKPKEKRQTCPRVPMEDEDKQLIVGSSSGSGVVESTSPAFKTRARGTPAAITQESINGVMEKTKCKLPPVKLSSKKYPLQLMCDFMGAMMDNETGELVEYQHLLASPKYCEV